MVLIKKFGAINVCVGSVFFASPSLESDSSHHNIGDLEKFVIVFILNCSVERIPNRMKSISLQKNYL